MKSYIRFLTRNKLYTAIMAVGLSVAFAFIIPTSATQRLIFFKISNITFLFLKFKKDCNKAWKLLGNIDLFN